jgi:hypothetical protein
MQCSSVVSPNIGPFGQMLAPIVGHVGPSWASWGRLGPIWDALKTHMKIDTFLSRAHGGVQDAQEGPKRRVKPGQQAGGRKVRFFIIINAVFWHVLFTFYALLMEALEYLLTCLARAKSVPNRSITCPKSVQHRPTST